MSYTFSLALKFPNGINIDQLQSEIILIIDTINGITTCDDLVEIIFTNVLSDEQIISLNNIINSHVPIDLIPVDNLVTVIPNITKINSTIFKRVVSINYNINRSSSVTIKFSGYMDSNITSYNVRVVDVINNLILANIEYFNKTEDINTLGSFNISSNTNVVEIHVKKTGGSINDTVHINNITYFV